MPQRKKSSPASASVPPPRMAVRVTPIQRSHWMGADGARGAAESHGAAISRIEEIVRSEQIDCDFKRVPGYLFLHEGGDPAELDKEMEAARRAGLSVDKLDQLIDGLQTAGAK